MAIVDGKLIITWCIEDVIERAKERDIKVTKKQAREILTIIDRRHDCNIGISWDTLDCWTDDYFDNLK